GAHWMPASRGEMRRDVSARHFVLNEIEAESAPFRGEAGAVSIECLHDQEPDGLAVWRYRAGPKAMVAGPDPAAGGGQYWLVISGSVSQAGIEMRPLSLAFVESGEKAFAGEAGSGGATIL